MRITLNFVLPDLQLALLLLPVFEFEYRSLMPICPNNTTDVEIVGCRAKL